MQETRIQTTERLRREGRWNEASDYREWERQRLRAEGKSRHDAKEESWRLMAESYTPLTPEEIDWWEASSWRAAARFAPQCNGMDGPSEPKMSDLWWVFCHLLASAARLETGDADGADKMLTTMVEEAPTEEAAGMALLAGSSPRRFLASLENRFRAVLARLVRQHPPVDEIYLQELSAHLEHAIPNASAAFGDGR